MNASSWSGPVPGTAGDVSFRVMNAGMMGWTTVHLDPGRYELLCNLPCHHAAGMSVEFDVR